MSRCILDDRCVCNYLTRRGCFYNVTNKEYFQLKSYELFDKSLVDAGSARLDQKGASKGT